MEDKSLILAIETSCDETAAAVVCGGGRTVLSNVISSQIPLHEKYGGVVPEIASRRHVECIEPVIEEALSAADVSKNDLSAIAVTAGPGLVGALLTGITCAKAWAYALKKPLVAVNHIEGHICANYITHPDLSPPFISLVVSGGHSHIVHVKDYCRYALIGRTIDDAAGEAFDKIARVLNLPYPGGPKLDALAENGNAAAYKFPRGRTPGAYDFSFSGLKTAVVQAIRAMSAQEIEQNRADISASLRAAIVSALLDKAFAAARMLHVDTVCLAGGVSGNALLRREAARMGRELDMRVYMPALILCTDNAAMIGSAAYFRFMRGQVADMTLNAQPALSMF